MKQVKLILVFTTIFFASCSMVTGIEYTKRDCLPRGMGMLTFYQAPGLGGSGLAPMVTVNKIEAGSIRKGGYISILLLPGAYEIGLVDNKADIAAWSEKENISAEMKVVEGEEKIYRFHVKSWSPGIPIPIGGAVVPVGGSRQSGIIEMPYEKAKTTLKKLKGKVRNMNGPEQDQNTVKCSDGSNS